MIWTHDNAVFSRAISLADLPRHRYWVSQSPSFINIATPQRGIDRKCLSYSEVNQMRCPKCRKTLDPGIMICPSCRTRIVAKTSSDTLYAGVLKPRSPVSTKGLGSRISGTSRVQATHHRISKDSSDSPLKVRCMKCNTVNDKSDRFCRKCRTRIT